jgi:hypothetical protein
MFTVTHNVCKVLLFLYTLNQQYNLSTVDLIAILRYFVCLNWTCIVLYGYDLFHIL